MSRVKFLIDHYQVFIENAEREDDCFGRVLFNLHDLKSIIKVMYAYFVSVR